MVSFLRFFSPDVEDFVIEVINKSLKSLVVQLKSNFEMNSQSLKIYFVRSYSQKKEGEREEEEEEAAKSKNKTIFVTFLFSHVINFVNDIKKYVLSYSNRLCLEI
jgi:hypothetical protein